MYKKVPNVTPMYNLPLTAPSAPKDKSLPQRNRQLNLKYPKEKKKTIMSGSLVEIHNLTLPSGPNIFYRSAGPPAAPVILLLHGFPSSSHQYRNLIPSLSTTGHHIIAPDFPGFGFTTVPDSSNYEYTFSSLTATTLEFLDALLIQTFSVYVFDYGAPVGFRIALERPNAVKAVISQNGNAYDEGLGQFWDPIKDLWKGDSARKRNVLEKSLLSFETTKFQYEGGVADKKLLAAIPPETYWLDYALLQRPGQVNIQLGLFADYASNVVLYPKFQAWLRKSNVPVLAIWGKNDVIFVREGAEAFKKDVKDLKLVLLDAGHFALETHGKQIAEEIDSFLNVRKL